MEKSNGRPPLITFGQQSLSYMPRQPSESSPFLLATTASMWRTMTLMVAAESKRADSVLRLSESIFANSNSHLSRRRHTIVPSVLERYCPSSFITSSPASSIVIAPRKKKNKNHEEEEDPPRTTTHSPRSSPSLLDIPRHGTFFFEQQGRSFFPFSSQHEVRFHHQSSASCHLPLAPLFLSPSTSSREDSSFVIIPPQSGLASYYEKTDQKNEQAPKRPQLPSSSRRPPGRALPALFNNKNYHDGLVKSKEAEEEEVTRTRKRTDEGGATLKLSSSVPFLTTTTISSPNEDDESCTRFRPYQSGNWMERYKELVEFHRQHGHCLVPNNYKKNPPLAEWVKRQRYQYKLKNLGGHNSMTKERVQKLEKLGFVWNSHDQLWEEHMNDLKIYMEIHGDCNVPNKYPPDPSLAVWVKRQRRQYRLILDGKESSLTPHRIKMLTEIGFFGKDTSNHLRSWRT